jgi:hypothetical protein
VPDASLQPQHTPQQPLLLRLQQRRLLRMPLRQALLEAVVAYTQQLLNRGW